jgi:hypothetical protein
MAIGTESAARIHVPGKRERFIGRASLRRSEIVRSVRRWQVSSKRDRFKCSIYQELAGYRHLTLKKGGYSTAPFDIFRRKDSAVDSNSLNEAGKQ